MSSAGSAVTNSGEKTAAKPKPPVRLFMKQKNMNRVLIALSPLLVLGVYFFGWRVVGLLAVCTAAGLATEYLTSRQRTQPISTACFVTCGLFALSLPPTVPLWIGVVGAVVGVLFGKEVFGGFGRNFANPAIVGRAFVYICFPNEMTADFVPTFRGWPGGFAHWSFENFYGGLHKLPEYLASAGRSVSEAVTAATPMMARREMGVQTSMWDLLTGQIGGVFTPAGETSPQVLSAGSIGEVCAIAIVLCGVYLIVTKTANWRLTLGMLAGAIGANVLFVLFFGGWTGAGQFWQQLLYDGSGKLPPLPFTLLSGALLYAAVFMVTDPVSAPKKMFSQWAYAVLIGVFVVLLRWQASFIGAVAFAILLGNLVGPLLDAGVEAWGEYRKAKQQPEGAAE